MYIQPSAQMRVYVCGTKRANQYGPSGPFKANNNVGTVSTYLIM